MECGVPGLLGYIDVCARFSVDAEAEDGGSGVRTRPSFWNQFRSAILCVCSRLIRSEECYISGMYVDGDAGGVLGDVSDSCCCCGVMRGDFCGCVVVCMAPRM